MIEFLILLSLYSVIVAIGLFLTYLSLRWDNYYDYQKTLQACKALNLHFSEFDLRYASFKANEFSWSWTTLVICLLTCGLPTIILIDHLEKTYFKKNNTSEENINTNITYSTYYPTSYYYSPMKPNYDFGMSRFQFRF